MTTMIALVFDERTAGEIQSLQESLGFEPTVPHLTMLKFQGEVILPNREDIEVEFAGLTILPSSKGGSWLEISVLKSTALHLLQQNLLNSVEGTILSGTGDEFRPHITLARVPDGELLLPRLSHGLLRRKIRVRLATGVEEGSFGFRQQDI